MSDSDLPDYALLNREAWTQANAEYTDSQAPKSWAATEITWGVWSTPESELHALPDVAGKDVIELGCGTAYFSAWLKRAGARRVVGVDITPAQLDTARRMDAQFGLGIELIEANAEEVPLEDAQFDLAVSEYGASIWCDPAKWIAEAARLLRPGGELVFLRNTTLAILCYSEELDRVAERLERPQRGLYKLEWGGDDPGVEFQAPHGDMIRILRSCGFEILDLIDVYPPPDAETHSYYSYVTPEWASKWPNEELWRARKWE